MLHLCINLLFLDVVQFCGIAIFIMLLIQAAYGLDFQTGFCYNFFQASLCWLFAASQEILIGRGQHQTG